MSEPAYTIGKYTLHGGGMCPEQYDVFDEQGNEVAYLRLRHGHFRASVGEDTVFTACPKGDGGFYYEERMGFLEQAIAAVDRKLNP